jgi:hypothetical protein
MDPNQVNRTYAISDNDMDVLINVAQLISGWRSTTPPEEWTSWDQETMSNYTKLLNRLHKENKSA